MRVSRSLKSSAHSLPSPNGAHIATILPSKLILRATRSLQAHRVLALPQDLSIVQFFLWSPSSNRILVCAAETIRVYSVKSEFSATITNPTTGTAKITNLAFGANDDEICVFSDFGLKLTIFNLSSITSIDITSPKFYGFGNASKGLTYRPRSQHLALLTRSAGKDVVSIHVQTTYEVVRSWFPGTIDAQDISWSPGGRWMAVCESASQGHKILFYTPDGHLYKAWNGPIPIGAEDKDASLGAGIRLLEWNSTGDLLALGDQSSNVIVLSAPSFTEKLRLQHGTTIKPVNGLQIWQEHITTSQSGQFERSFQLSTQTTCPPTTGSSPPNGDSDQKKGTSALLFDGSGTLIATKTDNMPTAVWIWDTASKVLKTVMILHSPIAKITWHPSISELLMIRCEGDESTGVCHLWEPSWTSPKILDFSCQVPENKIIGKAVIRWLNCDIAIPAVFFSDHQDCMLAVVSEAEDEDLPWQDSAPKAVDIYGQLEESPLNLVAANEKGPWDRLKNKSLTVEPTITGFGDGSDEVDDTFDFMKYPELRRN